MYKGAEVSILKTSNVENRYPERAGEKGIIEEVPVHPNTWYRVRFKDGKVLTFRPSALGLVTDNGEVYNHPKYNIIYTYIYSNICYCKIV